MSCGVLALVGFRFGRLITRGYWLLKVWGKCSQKRKAQGILPLGLSLIPTSGVASARQACDYNRARPGAGEGFMRSALRSMGKGGRHDKACPICLGCIFGVSRG